MSGFAFVQVLKSLSYEYNIEKLYHVLKFDAHKNVEWNFLILNKSFFSSNITSDQTRKKTDDKRWIAEQKQKYYIILSKDVYTLTIWNPSCNLHLTDAKMDVGSNKQILRMNWKCDKWERQKKVYKNRKEHINSFEEKNYMQLWKWQTKKKK